MRNFVCLQEMTNPVLEDAELEAGIAEQVANAKAILGRKSSPQCNGSSHSVLVVQCIAMP